MHLKVSNVAAILSQSQCVKQIKYYQRKQSIVCIELNTLNIAYGGFIYHIVVENALQELIDNIIMVYVV